MKIIVGLGNPGPRYAGTRHNIGFDVIDWIAAGAGTSPFRSRFQAQVAEFADATETALLIKPETFMNLSGASVRQVVDFYKRPATDVLVVCDDIALPLGKLRARAQGTHGGHNGLRDIQAHLGTTEYPRLRIGVGSPDGDAADFVLGRFRPTERPAVADAVARAAEAALVWMRQGITECMNRYNGEKKPKSDSSDKRRSESRETDASSDV
jgi:PTH1 family peptidyl-tRNA hydrolase